METESGLLLFLTINTKFINICITYFKNETTTWGGGAGGEGSI